MTFIAGFSKTAIHNSFVDETDAGDNAKGNPSIETQLSEQAAWKRKRRGQVALSLKETPIDSVHGAVKRNSNTPEAN